MDSIKFVTDRDPDEREFHQAVTEVIESVKPVLEQNPLYRSESIMERIVEAVKLLRQVSEDKFQRRASAMGSHLVEPQS